MGQIIIYTKELCIKYCEHITNRNFEQSGRAFDLGNSEADKNSEWVTVISSDTSMSCEINSTPHAEHSNAWRTPIGSCYCYQHTSNSCYHITFYCALTGNYICTVLICHSQISACATERVNTVIPVEDSLKRRSDADWFTSHCATRRHSTAVP
jgi:hypothetical protein